MRSIIYLFIVTFKTNFLLVPLQRNQPESVKLLLKSGANYHEKNAVGLTPPQLAFSKKLKDCNIVFLEFDPKVAFKVLECDACACRTATTLFSCIRDEVILDSAYAVP